MRHRMRPLGVVLFSALLIIGSAGPARAASRNPEATAAVDAATSANMVGLAKKYLDQRTDALLASSGRAVTALANTSAVASRDLVNAQQAALTELRMRRAGGWADDTGWYRDPWNWWYNSLNQTWSWINVGYWYEFAAVHSKRTYILGSPDYLLLSDVLQMDFTNNGSKDHSMIASYIGSQPYLTYHTTDTFRRSLSSLKSAYPSARWLPHRT